MTLRLLCLVTLAVSLHVRPVDLATQTPVDPAAAPVKRTADGKPDLNGFFQSDAGGANWGLEAHKETFTPGGRGVIIDPPDKKLPYQPWAAAEKASRNPTSL